MFDFFKKLFPERQPERTESITMLSGSNGLTSTFSGDLRQSDVFISAVHAIAIHASKMTISHITLMDGARGPGDPRMNRMLGLQPNPICSAAEFLYKCASLYWSDNNLFILLERARNGSVLAMWPLKPSSGQFITDPSNTLYIKFLFTGGQTVILPYSDVVHIRRIFHGNDLLADNNNAIIPAVGLSTAQTNGLTQNIESAGTIRGILRFPQQMRPEDLEAQRQKFIGAYLKPGGATIAALCANYEYTPLDQPSITIPADEIEAIGKKIFNYLGVNASIVDGSFSEDIYSSFVEASLEPFANTLSQALTVKMFTDREIAWGNQISVDTAGRMAFASQKTKITALKELMPLSLLTLDQALSVLGFPPVGGEEGSRRIQSLNYVDQANALEYQMANAGVDNKLKGDKINEGN
ncbi:MAG: phage portal protein [Firmicutes bacterium]|nr:phage portal protein [Bacillota bacterium]